MLMAMLPLKELIKLPGIQDGILFHENVRQSLGSSGAVDERSDLFSYNNGIVALCSTMHLESEVLSLWDLSVVSGCQLLNTILSCGETVKEMDDAFVLFRVHEVPQPDHRDQIAICSSWRSAVTASDLRSRWKRAM